MQKYIEVAFKARWLDPDFDWLPLCEVCEEENNFWIVLYWKINVSVDVDHIWWRRWSLMLDPKNLIFVCREHHENKWWFSCKQKREHIVKLKLEKISW